MYYRTKSKQLRQATQNLIHSGFNPENGKLMVTLENEIAELKSVLQADAEFIEADKVLIEADKDLIESLNDSIKAQDDLIAAQKSQILAYSEYSDAILNSLIALGSDYVRNYNFSSHTLYNVEMDNLTQKHLKGEISDKDKFNGVNEIIIRYTTF
ncbi:hypothetical protein [Mucilaginibacter terrae]|uniref:Uncharacterized protein n=1 Tax=Mucilaginibacter terrae TaxID=1955052 RepID=A0ABU3GZ57_9SPHI|nr:hypothetical protein [Mucilaginibacter terrae]MDT3403955.1 hypothetical protein [Mucilaginibacter terrae]